MRMSPSCGTVNAAALRVIAYESVRRAAEMNDKERKLLCGDRNNKQKEALAISSSGLFWYAKKI